MGPVRRIVQVQNLLSKGGTQGQRAHGTSSGYAKSVPWMLAIPGMRGPKVGRVPEPSPAPNHVPEC
eukprot:5028727-Prymnesium_polylepis.3